MKPKNARKIRITLALASCSLIPAASAADCYRIYTNAANVCAIAQTNRDNGATTMYNASVTNAQMTATNKVNQNAIAAALAEQTCQTNLNMSVGDPNVSLDVGTCGNDALAANTAADSAYNTAVATCNQLYPTDQTARVKCICQAAATREHSKGSALAGSIRCAADAYNKYNNSCMAAANALQNKDNRLANAQFAYDEGLALATYRKVTEQSRYTRLQCDAQAHTVYQNCLLGLGCSQNSANCCAANCNKELNNAIMAALAAWYNTVGPAAAQAEYDLVMCNTTQTRNDQVSYANGQYAIDLAYAKYVFDQESAWNIYMYARAMADAQCTKDTALCGCNNTDPNQYYACVATANAAQAGAYASAFVVYQRKTNGQYCTPVGENWTAWNQSVTNANAAIMAAYASHMLTARTCGTNAETIFNAVLEAADEAYNRVASAAYEALQRCLEDCEQSG
ncbi:MAG: hypothetical protein BWY57_02832 [Betaproteobacteria bacterium ADurb.Bin341]|nr:MAG: hypothetical protein BWY57_02832 [Betaproteobacteria bacterium ADurb.Bin341]HPY30669.1 hypothetical protein [Verrucomicrobiota bacterium]